VVAAGPFTSASAGTFHACAIAGGALYCWGRNIEGQLGLGDLVPRALPARVGDRSDWAEVSVGRFHTCAMDTSSAVYCTGANAEGELGTGDRARRNVFTLVTF